MLLKINVRDSTIQKIDTALLKVFGRSYAIRFPIDPRTELDRIPRCKHMSYDQLEKVAHCTHRDVISACKSINGCTTYDPIKKRYMVYINYSDCDSLSFRRVRWTTAHEIGHIVCGHFIELIEAGAPDVSPSDVRLFEDEADYFAACLLAPLPVMDRLGIKSVEEIHRKFLLSWPASEYCLSDLKRYQTGDTFYPYNAGRILKECRPILSTELRSPSRSDIRKLDDFLYYP